MTLLIAMLAAIFTVSTLAVPLDSRALLVDLLLNVAEGKGPCSFARQMCRRIDAGTIHDNIGLKELAKCPASNFERDLHRWADRQAWREFFPQLYCFELTTLSGLLY